MDMTKPAAWLFLPALFAQVSGADPWDNLRAQNPSGLELSLRLTSTPHAYHSGELIPIEVNPPAHPAVTRSDEIWPSGGFLLDPAMDCGSLQKPCFGPGGIATGGLFAPQSGPEESILN